MPYFEHSPAPDQSERGGVRTVHCATSYQQNALTSGNATQRRKPSVIGSSGFEVAGVHDEATVCTPTLIRLGSTLRGRSAKTKGEQVGVAYAAQLYGSAPLSHYSKLGPSTPAVKGDVAVWGSGLPNGTAGAGHVAIVLADQGGSLQILTQNSGATHIGSMSKAYLTGLLRPKNLAPPSNNPIGSIDEVASPRA